MKLHNLLPPYGIKHKKRRVGRGDSSGQGSHGGKGMSGERSRKGRVHYLGFEGGQMPLYRRLPKRGFTPLSKERYQEVNLYSLNSLKDEKEVTPELLFSKGLIKKKDGKIKILGVGTIEVTLIVKAHKFSKRAKEEIIKKGGSAIEISIGKEIKIERPALKEKAKKTEEKKIEKKEEKIDKLELVKEPKEEKKTREKEKKIIKEEKTVKVKKIAKSTEKKKAKTTKEKKEK